MSDSTSVAAMQVVNSVLNHAIGAVVEDVHGAAHGAGLQQLMYWTCPSVCSDDALIASLTAGFAKSWVLPSPKPSLSDGVVACATFVIDNPSPKTPSDILAIVFGMCLATLLQQISACYMQPATAAPNGLNKLPDDFEHAITKLMDVLINQVEPYDGSLADYIALSTSSLGAAIANMTFHYVISPGVKQAMISMMTPYLVIKYMCMFDPLTSDRADISFFDARYASSAVFAVYADALQQMTTMTPTTSTRGLTPDDIAKLTQKYTLLLAAIPTVSSKDIVSMYGRVSSISTATRTMATRIKGTDREIAMRTGVTGAQVANVAYSRSRLQSERIQMWMWIGTVVLTTVVAASLIATGHTPQFWLLAIITFVVLALLAMIGFFRTPHPSNDSSF